MNNRISTMLQAIRSTLGRAASSIHFPANVRKGVVLLGVTGAVAYGMVQFPPMRTVGRGEVAVRTNHLTGGTTILPEGLVLSLPGIHEMRTLSLRDQTYRPAAAGETPFQSGEGLSLGLDMSIRYGLDQLRLAQFAPKFPADIPRDVVAPDVEGVIYKVLTRYTVREIFSSKRAEIQQAIEAELKPKLAADGIVLRSVTIGKVVLPEDFKAGMEKLLAEELESEKMRYTLELKEKQVRQTALEADADKVRREKEAEAAASEQIIAAKAQEEAMRHVLPFKEKQVKQRELEAEAEKTARIKTSEGNAQARIIEAAGEADSRRKLADAEAYRQELVGKVASAQMERDGELLTKHPLLIQKTMADKLSDKVSVIIAPPPADGGFIGSTLVGAPKTAHAERIAANSGE
ncbi:prohibitin family protein [Pseudoduganella eburnea]|uniref:Prohibitin family protein n=1 Tax=Massilia eburnea TaxID=1776165 RepID=A0A6L6QQQ2_9BURK|nr:SPFH domain-containing protein [Massilia eburnea]MTW14431.1 prohibitin family protein [Massilia eburnea]